MDEITGIVSVDFGNPAQSQQMAGYLLRELRPLTQVRLAEGDELKGSQKGERSLVMGALAVALTASTLVNVAYLLMDWHSRQNDSPALNFKATDLPKSVAQISEETVAELERRSQGSGITIQKLTDSQFQVGGDMAGGDIIKDNVIVVIVEAGGNLTLGIPTRP